MSDPRDPLFPEPDLSPEPGWGPAPSLGVYRPQHSFVAGDPDGQRLRIRYWVREEDGNFVGKVWFGPDAEGPPICAHGGALAAVLDDAMGRAAWVAGHQVLAGRIVIDFRAKCPLGVVHRVETEITRDDARKVVSRGRIVAGDGTLIAEGEGIFVKITAAYFEEEARRLRALGHDV